MDTSDLLKICPITAYPTAPVTLLAPFSQLGNVMHTRERRSLDLMQICFRHTNGKINLIGLDEWYSGKHVQCCSSETSSHNYPTIASAGFIEIGNSVCTYYRLQCKWKPFRFLIALHISSNALKALWKWMRQKAAKSFKSKSNCVSWRVNKAIS